MFILKRRDEIAQVRELVFVHVCVCVMENGNYKSWREADFD